MADDNRFIDKIGETIHKLNAITAINRQQSDKRAIQCMSHINI